MTESYFISHLKALVSMCGAISKEDIETATKLMKSTRLPHASTNGKCLNCDRQIDYKLPLYSYHLSTGDVWLHDRQRRWEKCHGLLHVSHDGQKINGLKKQVIRKYVCNICWDCKLKDVQPNYYKQTE